MKIQLLISLALVLGSIDMVAAFSDAEMYQMRKGHKQITRDGVTYAWDARLGAPAPVGGAAPAPAPVAPKVAPTPAPVPAAAMPVITQANASAVASACEQELNAMGLAGSGAAADPATLRYLNS